MKILIIDNQGAALDWALRCKAAGHAVRWFIRDERMQGVGKGLVERVSNWRDHMRWSDLVFLPDNTYYIHELEPWRRDGWPIFGCNKDAAELELNRGVGMVALEGCGVHCPPSKVFTDYDKAIAYVKREGRRFVSKPSGDADKALSYVSKSPADMVYMLERWKKLQKFKAPFILQEFIPGTEMAVGAFFGPGGFKSLWCENWEFKKLMNGDLGVATGEQGTVLRFVSKSKLADKVLQPCEYLLDEMSYVGYVDINCIIDEGGTPWPLEFTCRPGWPTFNIQQALHHGDPAEWMSEVLTGSWTDCWEPETLALGVVLSIPDYPYSKVTRKEVRGTPIYGLENSDLDRIHPCEIMQGEAPVMRDGKVVTEPVWVTAGDYVLVASGTGDTIKAAKTAAYRVLEKLEVPNSPMYRTDIGDRLRRQLPGLQAHGYAKGVEWTRGSSSAT